MSTTDSNWEKTFKNSSFVRSGSFKSALLGTWKNFKLSVHEINWIFSKFCMLNSLLKNVTLLKKKGLKRLYSQFEFLLNKKQSDQKLLRITAELFGCKLVSKFAANISH